MFLQLPRQLKTHFMCRSKLLFPSFSVLNSYSIRTILNLWGKKQKTKCEKAHEGELCCISVCGTAVWARRSLQGMSTALSILKECIFSRLCFWLLNLTSHSGGVCGNILLSSSRVDILLLESLSHHDREALHSSAGVLFVFCFCFWFCCCCFRVILIQGGCLAV